ncbi:MAG: phosphate ABC transporter permease PstA [Armatimonadota bacterium]
MKRRINEIVFKTAAISATGIIVAALLAILGTIIVKGAGSLSWSLITKPPTGDYYLGGGGGVANAVVGSFYLGIGATVLALLISLPTVLYLRSFGNGTRFASIIRGLLDVLWGVPSIVFGAFGFTLMIILGLRASLLAGIITVAMFELPIMIRSIDEVVKMVPHELDEASYALGATRFETAVKVIAKQALPGIITGSLLAFGRGVGDAASVMFTAGFTDRMPDALSQPAATLPLSIFFQLGTPFEEVQMKAYGAALLLVILVLSMSIISRVLSTRLSRYVVK